MCVVLALGNLRQEELEFKSSLGDLVSSCHKNKYINKQNKLGSLHLPPSCLTDTALKRQAFAATMSECCLYLVERKSCVTCCCFRLRYEFQGVRVHVHSGRDCVSFLLLFFCRSFLL
jgi:hypothetical protein